MQKDLIEQVQLARSLVQPLDEEVIASANKASAKSYVPADNIPVLTEVVWTTNKDEVLAVLRNDDTPKVDSAYLNNILGEGKNGIKDRSCLRFESGHLNINTLRMATTRVRNEGQDEEAHIFDMKITPSMKNVVYSVYIIFSSQGIYLAKLSKCDCPNGWLFCSHTLACFLLIYLIQTKPDWTFDQIVQFMPVPIKSLQSLPLAASYVFDELKISKPGSKMGKKKSDDEYTKSIAKSIAGDIPGYSGKYNVNDADAVEEGRIISADMSSATNCEVKSIDLCKRVDEKVADEVNTNERSQNVRSKVTMASITSYNHNLVSQRRTDKALLRQLNRHERLHRMMEDGAISKDSALSFYVDHFKEDR